MQHLSWICVFELYELAPSKRTYPPGRRRRPGVCRGRRFRIPFRRLGISPMQGASLAVSWTACRERTPRGSCRDAPRLREEWLSCLMFLRYVYQAPAIGQIDAMGCEERWRLFPAADLSPFTPNTDGITEGQLFVHLGLMRLFPGDPRYVPGKGPAFAGGSWRPLICFTIISVAEAGSICATTHIYLRWGQPAVAMGHRWMGSSPFSMGDGADGTSSSTTYLPIWEWVYLQNRYGVSF